jgi:hypothetical protein
MEYLFISPTEIKATTVIGGNTDNDKFVFVISDVQNTTILPLLGQELYEKVSAEAEAGTLAGLYLEMYTKFVQPITKYQTVANYVMISNYMVDNGGTSIHQASSKQAVDESGLERLSNTYAGMADTYIDRFQEWIKFNHLTEYKIYQEGVDASKHVSNRGGWFFGLPSNAVMEQENQDEPFKNDIRWQ